MQSITEIMNNSKPVLENIELFFYEVYRQWASAAMWYHKGRG